MPSDHLESWHWPPNPTPEEYDLAEDRRLRALGINPNADPEEIMRKLTELYRKYHGTPPEPPG